MLLQCVKQDVVKVAFVLMARFYLMENASILLFVQVNFMCLTCSYICKIINVVTSCNKYTIGMSSLSGFYYHYIQSNNGI